MEPIARIAKGPPERRGLRHSAPRLHTHIDLMYLCMYVYRPLKTTSTAASGTNDALCQSRQPGAPGLRGGRGRLSTCLIVF